MPVHLPVGQLLELAEQFGTPLYVYHADRIAHQYHKLKKAFESVDARLYYACKALSNIHILSFIRSLGASLDCVSIYEVKLGLM
ncbi:MAG TPA: diaminopimelate decarboxylase, partial [Ferruginibacter sp.]|nr:diaminopimelate decarboxylase [Ferruginibacter sp.]